MEGKKILIIEDEEMMIAALTRKLIVSGFEVYSARDGREGLERALELKPDLILLDLILPVFDGLTFLEKLRVDPWGAKIPVIVLTNLSRVSAVEESRGHGVHHYLVKTDWKLEDVVQKIKSELKL